MLIKLNASVRRVVNIWHCSHTIIWLFCAGWPCITVANVVLVRCKWN